MQTKNTIILIDKEITQPFLQKPILNLLFRSWPQFSDLAY